MPAFFVHTLSSLAQVKRAAGLHHGALLGDRRWTFWTMTLWQDQGAMRRYMTSGAHLKAMPKLLDWCDEASIVHWNQAGDALPSWEEADRRMRSEGRASKVRNPGPDHQRLSFAPPRIRAPVPILPKRPRR